MPTHTVTITIAGDDAAGVAAWFAHWLGEFLPEAERAPEPPEHGPSWWVASVTTEAAGDE